MLDVDYYVNNIKDAESSLDSYDNYIGIELNSLDADVNEVYIKFRKRVWIDDGQSVGIVNW